tara:strand:+ start:6212 stop:7525 length:1314 start_codon:yes stop_codon:yes gene_type:complete
MDTLFSKINKNIVAPFEKVVDTTIYGHIVYLIDIQLLLIFNFCKQNVKCNSKYIENIVFILQNEEITGGGLIPKVIKKKLNKFFKNKKVDPKIQSKTSVKVDPKIQSKTSKKVESQPTSLKVSKLLTELEFSNPAKIIINNFINSLITTLIKILNSKSAVHYTMVGLNKKTDINTLENIKTLDHIENKIVNLCEFLFIFKTKCLNNLLCKNKAPSFLREDKIQSKINMLNLKTIPILPTTNEPNSKLKILAEITDIYLTTSKTHNKELSKNYTELILVLNIKKSMLDSANNNLNKNDINTPLTVSNKSDNATSNKSDNFNIIYTIFDALNNIKSIYNYHLDKIINKLYSGNKLVIHKKIKRIFQNIKNVNDWLCVICILLHSIPDIETKIKDGLLSDYLNIITMQKALYKYYGGMVNNDNIYILITILFNPPKINII